MIRISNLNLGLEDDMDKIIQKSAKLLHVDPKEVVKATLIRQSVDARKKNKIHYIATVDISLSSEKKESNILKNSRNKQISAPSSKKYQFPPIKRKPKQPVVVGMGPSGLFSSLFLAKAGVPPIILERGKAVEQRLVDVEAFWRSGILNPQSNVQFGEGGAGTFSDGKLTTGTKDPRNAALFQILVDMGAPDDILYSHKPHIGTDVLQTVLQNLRKELISLGCEIRFEHQMVGMEKTGDQLTGLRVRCDTGEYLLPTSDVVLAVGHSARDTFEAIYEEAIPIEGKRFAVGARIEHLQREMGFAQYGEAYSKLPPSDYKLACHLPSGRSLFTFCVCPGGVVVNASSSQGRLVTNGMSYRNRDHENINGGLLVGVGPEDFKAHGGDHPLSGMYFQEHWEKIAYEVSGGWQGSCQRVEDFLLDRPSEGCGLIKPSFTSGVVYGDVRKAMPPEITATMVEGLPLLGQKVSGFDHPDALLTAIETRSSSPIRILRDESYQSALRGLYPCGEGAGYAGGIVSAAVDGIKVAEAMLCLSS